MSQEEPVPPSPDQAAKSFYAIASKTLLRLTEEQIKKMKVAIRVGKETPTNYREPREGHFEVKVALKDGTKTSPHMLTIYHGSEEECRKYADSLKGVLGEQYDDRGLHDV